MKATVHLVMCILSPTWLSWFFTPTCRDFVQTHKIVGLISNMLEETQEPAEICADHISTVGLPTQKNGDKEYEEEIIRARYIETCHSASQSYRWSLAIQPTHPFFIGFDVQGSTSPFVDHRHLTMADYHILYAYPSPI